jgi:ribosomal-protein-alanine N-acetyltransferase
MPPIATARLDLIPLTADLYEASLAGRTAAHRRDRREGAEILPGLAIAPEWFAMRTLLQMRLEQLRAEPSLAPWLLRAIALRSERIVIGHIGFHGAPGAPYLRKLAPQASSPGSLGAEFGYTIYPAWRRQGYAREASLALMRWAAEERGVSRFVLSISPTNIPSLRLAEQLGFTRIGSQLDDEDGSEDVFERRTTPGQTLQDENS